jgi:hypothetical protein
MAAFGRAGRARRVEHRGDVDRRRVGHALAGEALDADRAERRDVGHAREAPRRVIGRGGRVPRHVEREPRVAVRRDRVDLAGREARRRQDRPRADPADREREHERLDRVLADEERAVARAQAQRRERMRRRVDGRGEARVAHDAVGVAQRGTLAVAGGGFGEQIDDARTRHGID